jgi:hypothetical protein
MEEDPYSESRPMNDSSSTPDVRDELAAKPPAPPEVVREVASQLKSLSTIMPYEEYASIVHRVARLKWQCVEGSARPTEIGEAP